MMEATKRPLRLLGTDDEGWLIAREDIHGKNRTMAHVYDRSLAEQIVRAVNTFEQAKAALKRSLNYLLNTQRSLGIEEGAEDELSCTKLCREALAAMETPQ